MKGSMKFSKRMTPKLTVDAVIQESGNVYLIRRKFRPFAGFYALPGGFVDYGETVESAVVREAFEETGLKVKIVRLLGVYSDPKRDPRGHTASVVFLCKPAGGSLVTSTNETKDVRSFAKSDLKKIKLAFDHGKILKDAGLL
jgi:8-oxo-dGTP diphosphatase